MTIVVRAPLNPKRKDLVTFDSPTMCPTRFSYGPTNIPPLLMCLALTRPGIPTTGGGGGAETAVPFPRRVFFSDLWEVCYPTTVLSNINVR